MKLPLVIGFWLLVPLWSLAQGPVRRATLSTPSSASSWPSQPNIHPAVVRIVAPGQGSISYGSGTLVSTTEQAGLVITNWHVINEVTGPISVHFSDGFYSLGSIQKVDRDWDLAAIAITKPKAKPVELANEAPRPGELLTIAGYGSGVYRAVSGRCTQYVAPGTTFPYEMVEVAVSARQGDSGGPIFNSRGELAGVLFGEGHGRTSGSYCGRVRWFLASVVPSTAPISQGLAAAQTRPPGPAATFSTVEPPRSQTQQTTASAVSTTAATNVAMIPLPRGPVMDPIVVTAHSSEPTPSVTRTLGWEDFAGTTLADQAKTVLAAIGVLAILLHALRWASAEPKPA